MAEVRVYNLEMKGIGVSPGIAWGKVYILDRGQVEIKEVKISTELVGREIGRLHRALEESKKQLEELRNKVRDAIGEDHLYILDTHKMILEDKLLTEDIERRIREEGINAEWALKRALEDFGRLFQVAEDDYLKERKADIDHVGYRVLRNLVGRRLESVAEITGQAIVVARDLAPSDTAQMTRGNVFAFATDIGSRTSHTAIMARSLGIPAVVGLKEITQHARTGDIMVVDGASGTVIINPTERVLKEYEERRRRFYRLERSLLKLRELEAVTRDGYRVKLSANVELMEEIPTLKDYGAQGIGLYRTEFLYLDRVDLPCEEEHFGIYRRVVEGTSPHQAVIRTVDLGGDKFVSKLKVAKDINPAMGLRAIRLCLREPSLFKVQLRALLRASAYGKLKIMFPMISGVDEIRQAKALLNEAREELKGAGIPFDPHVEIGIMVEVPSAALVADLLAREVDFFSIGTNDLIQYFLAIDRVNEQVAYLYEPLHPALLRCIKGVVDSAHRAGIPVSMCGEMAGEPLYALILLGLGLDELSMAPHAIPVMKKVIRETTLAQGRQLLEEVLALSTAQEIEERVREKMASLFPRGFSDLIDLEATTG